MTRINVGVEPFELPDKLLLAEHREITRIPNMVKRGRVKMDGIPERFRLGTGHVKFFYNKLQFLRSRYVGLYAECRRRGFEVTDRTSAFDGVPAASLHDYSPSPADRQIILDRIQSRGFQITDEQTTTKDAREGIAVAMNGYHEGSRSAQSPMRSRCEGKA